jgi:hypothetical protein
LVAIDRKPRRGEAGLRAPDARLGGLKLRAALPDLRPEQTRIDLRQEVALLHLGVEVGEHPHHAPRDLRADLHFLERFHRAGRLHLLEDVALLELLRGEARRRRGLGVAAPGEHSTAGCSEG